MEREEAAGRAPEKEGWERRFIASEPRLSEAVEMYRTLGFDVRLEPLPEKPAEGECRRCLEMDIERYRIIYTRKRTGSPAPEKDDLS